MSNAAAIIEAMRNNAEVQEIEVIGADGTARPVLSVPTGRSLVSAKRYLDEYLPKPERRRGTATLTTEVSFIAHVNRFKNPESVVFVADKDAASASLLAVYDYNPAGPDTTSAAFGVHRAKYSFPVSEEWKAWVERDGEELGAVAFAAFIEEHIGDVVVVDLEQAAALKAMADLVGGRFATPSSLMALSRGVEININSAVASQIRLDSGERKLVYSEVHDDGTGAPLTIPNLFVVQIPVFRDGAAYRIACRLRYRIGGDKRPMFWYEMVKPEMCVTDAIKDVVKTVAAETGVVTLYGSPEA